MSKPIAVIPLWYVAPSHSTPRMNRPGLFGSRTPRSIRNPETPTCGRTSYPPSADCNCNSFLGLSAKEASAGTPTDKSHLSASSTQLSKLKSALGELCNFRLTPETLRKLQIEA